MEPKIGPEATNPKINPKKMGFWAMIKSLSPKARWKGDNGYGHVLRICLPLIASNISVSAMLFTDRLVLSHYSLEAIAASLPAGIAFVTVSSFFQGLVAFVTVFVAQYTGAGRHHRTGAALWQGLYLAAISGLIIGLSWFWAPALFEFGGHTPEVQKQEVIYYRMLCLPAAVNMLYFAMSSFLAGLGRTKMVMWVNLLGALINIPLTIMLVFGVEIAGVLVLSDMGIKGAALSTVIAWVVTVLVFTRIIFNRKMQKNHNVFKAWGFDSSLLKRMVSYGFPGGLQRFAELAAFTYFAFIIGRLGELHLATNNIIFSIESLAFFPMLGVGATISILVGQSIGRGQPDVAAKAVVSGIGISSIYMVMMAFVFLVFPRPLLGLFLGDHYAPEVAEQILILGQTMLFFVVLYTVFDGLYLCCFGALNGAGDVWFPTIAMGLCGCLTLVLPVEILFYYDKATVSTLWLTFVFYVLALTSVGAWRYHQGKWRSMRVIENS